MLNSESEVVMSWVQILTCGAECLNRCFCWWWWKKFLSIAVITTYYASPRNRNAERMSFECVGSTRNREVLAWAATKSCGCAGSRRISHTWYTQTDSTYKIRILKRKCATLDTRKCTCSSAIRGCSKYRKESCKKVKVRFYRGGGTLRIRK